MLFQTLPMSMLDALTVQYALLVSEHLSIRALRRS